MLMLLPPSAASVSLFAAEVAVIEAVGVSVL